MKIERQPLVESFRKSGRYQRVFTRIAGIVLIITALAKLGSIFQKLPILFAVDPILFLSYKQIVLFVGSIELFVALVIFATKNELIKIYLVTWLGGCFMAYRILYKIEGIAEPCPCLGVLTAWLHIGRYQAQILLFSISAFMFGIGLLFILSTSFSRPSAGLMGCSDKGVES